MVPAPGTDLAILQLRVDIAEVRAERDGLRLEVAEGRAERAGLRLEVEGLRAELVLAREELTDRAGLNETVHQLKSIVGRLNLTQPVSDPPADEPVAPVADPGADLVGEPPSALARLRAMGVWPPRDGAPGAPAPTELLTSPFAPPTADRAIPAPPIERRSTISWDPLRTLSAPMVAASEPGDDDHADAIGDDAPGRSTGRRILVRAGSIVGIIVVTLVLAVTVGPRFLPYQTYFVRSGSMRPTIDVGAMVVLTKTDASQLDVGDIITFDNPDKPGTLVTHRIAGIEQTATGRVFTTKGDANSTQDAWKVPATGTGWKLAFGIPYLGYAFGYLGTPQARLALLAVPGVLLGLLTLVDIWHPKAGGTRKQARASRRSR